MGYGSSVAVSCGVGRRCSSDPALLWLWHRLAAVAPTRSLVWESPYAASVAPPQKKALMRKLMGCHFVFILAYLWDKFLEVIH